MARRTAQDGENFCRITKDLTAWMNEIEWLNGLNQSCEHSCIQFNYLFLAMPGRNWKCFFILQPR